MLLTGLAAGVAGGAVAAVAIPQTKTAPSASEAAQVAPASIGVRRVVEASRRANPREIELRTIGPVRVAATVADPRGGPAWAVRAFAVQRIASGAYGRGGRHVVGRNRCVQLGRLYRGRFGWLTADGTFRRVAATSTSGAPQACLSHRPDLGGEPFADVITTITPPRGAAAEPGADDRLRPCRTRRAAISG